MRGGLFFAAGMYFQMGCKFQTYQPKYERFIRPSTKKVILVDAVINTGKTITEIFEPDMSIYNKYSRANATNGWRLQQERNQVCALQQISLFCNK